MPAQEGPHVRSAVNRTTIPQQDDVPAEVTQQQAHEDRYLDMRDVVEVEMRVKAALVTPRADRHCRNRRDAVVAVAVTNDRGVATRCPRAPYGRDEQKAALIKEHQMGVQSAGFFLMAAHL